MEHVIEQVGIFASWITLQLTVGDWFPCSRIKKRATYCAHLPCNLRVQGKQAILQDVIRPVMACGSPGQGPSHATFYGKSQVKSKDCQVRTTRYCRGGEMARVFFSSSDHIDEWTETNEQ